MALDAVFSIAKYVAENSVEPIGRQLGLIVFYRSNAEDLNTQLDKLEVAKGTLQQRVDAAKQKGEEILANVQNWLLKVEGIVSVAKDFQKKEERESVRCFGGPFSILCIRHDLSKEAVEMVKEISEVLTQGNFNEISYLHRLRVSFPPFARGYEALDSRTSMLNEIMQQLKNDKVYVTGVYGMGGVGKSTLIKQVAWQAEQDGSFGAVIVATVTSSPDVKRIQGQLADGLGLRFKEESEEGRARRLWDRIRKENQILVILDDIWKELDLMEVGVPFGNEHKGCKLLLTSRDLNVLNKMGTQKHFRLETLSREESWDLFEKTAGDVVKDILIQPTAVEVARACMGLPLSLVTVAKALKNQESYAWKDALTQLAKCDHEGFSVANEAVELSYKYLESDQHRSLFLLIGGAKDWHTEDLRLYGWGLGLYKNVETLANARNRLYKLIDDLKASSLLLEGTRERVRMHDVILEVASKIAARAQLVFRVQDDAELKEWPKMDELRNYKYIILLWYCMPELPESLECPKLEMLVLYSRDNYLNVPDQFLSGMRYLKVLDLGGMMCTPSLPPSLRLLKSLKALYLCGCILGDISIVSELTSLEILSLEYSEIQELPKEIRQLTHLQLLNLGNCSGLRLMPANIISSLTCLEELYMGNCYIKWEVEGSHQHNNASLGELRRLHHLKSLQLQIHDTWLMPRDLLIFGKLERYNILIGDCWQWSYKYFGYSDTPRTLKLKLDSTTLTHLDRGVNILLNTVEDLSLAELKDVTNVLPQLNGEGFPQLKHLLIQNSAEILCIVDLSEQVHPQQSFFNLESMVLCNLINLEKICCGQLPLHTFDKLQVIKVEGCHKLKNIFSFSMVRNLPQLLEIEISECKFMTNVIVEQGQEEFVYNAKINFPKIHSIKLECLPKLGNFSSKRTTYVQSGSNITKYRDNLSNPPALFDEKIAMPNLETLKLSSMNMAKLWDDTSALSYIQNLTHLTIDSCGSLKYLCSSLVGIALVKLQYLKIANCQMMEDIIVLGEKLGNLHSARKPLTSEQATFPSLETLVVSHMDNLKSVYHDEMAPNRFPKMIKMEISFCQKLLSVFPSHVLNNLHKLETLVVTDCDALEIVFETQGLNSGATSQGKQATQLKTLTLERLPMLKHIWSNDHCGSLQLQNLCIMKVTDCKSLSHVFRFSVTTELSKLQELNIKDCGVESIVAVDEMVKEVPRLVFPQLISLTFWRLEKLISFCPRKHTLHCPMIRKLDVLHCSKLVMFKSKSQNYEEVVPFHGQPLLSSPKVIPNIEELSLRASDVTSICNGEILEDDDLYGIKALSLRCFHDKSNEFPMDFLERFINIENLDVRCGSFVEIFSSEHAGTIMKLKTLALHELNNLEYLCNKKSKIQPILQNLEILEVYWCSKLKNVVQPSSLELFQNLDELHVVNCSKLVNIIIFSMAKSLLKLRVLWIYNCERVENIVASEDDNDGGELAFMKLKHLQLQNLPRLTSFCKGNFSLKFPLLGTLYVVQCPKMKSFSHGILSTPILRRVRTEYGVGEWHWEGELDTTIRKIFHEKC